MLKNAFDWIKCHGLSRQGVLFSPQVRKPDPEAAGRLIPVFVALGEENHAFRCADWLASIQKTDGSIPTNESDDNSCTAAVIMGWLALLPTRSGLESQIRLACDWLIQKLISPSSRFPLGLGYFSGHTDTESHPAASNNFVALAAIKQAGDLLNETAYQRILAERSRNNISGPERNIDLCFENRRMSLNADIIESLLGLELKEEATMVLERILKFQQPNGAIPALSNVNWVCVSALARLAKSCFKLGKPANGSKAVNFLAELQNHSGGFFGSYGIQADFWPASEINCATIDYIDAVIAKQKYINSIEVHGVAEKTKNAVKAAANGLPLQRSNGKKKVLLVTYLREKNFGDILLYQTVKHKLEKSGFETDHVEVYKTGELIARANKSAFLYFVGGGLIERWAPEIIYKFDSIHPHLQVPYGVVSLSTGAFDYRPMHPSLKLLAEKAKFFYTRDIETVHTFVKAGASRPPLAGVDIVFANDQLAEYFRTGTAIRANFRDVPYTDVTGDIDWPTWSEVLKKVGVDMLVKDSSGAQLALGIPVADEDEFTAIGRCEVIVAMRYHVVLSAAMMGVLPIPITYCPKVQRLATQLGIEEYCLDQSEPGRLINTVDRLKRNADQVRAAIKSKLDGLILESNSIIKHSIDEMRATCYE